jgi:hypothetical protein
MSHCDEEGRNCPRYVSITDVPMQWKKCYLVWHYKHWAAAHLFAAALGGALGAYAGLGGSKATGAAIGAAASLAALTGVYFLDPSTTSLEECE